MEELKSIIEKMKLKKENPLQGNKLKGRYSKELLRKLRNDIPLAILIADFLRLPSKISEGYFRFCCPICSEFNTAINPKTNLARCFSCRVNFNPIDMVMQVNRINFREAVEYLSGIKAI